MLNRKQRRRYWQMRKANLCKTLSKEYEKEKVTTVSARKLIQLFGTIELNVRS